VSGCGGGDDSGADETETEAARAEPGETPLDARCLRVPRALAKRTTQELKPDIRAVATTWQMTRSKQTYPGGFKKPVLVSARLLVDKNPPAIATWAAKKVRTGPVIPIDGVAKDVSVVKEGTDPDKYSDILEDGVYVTSRSCVQGAFALQQKKREKREKEPGQSEGGG
jgi:hypothetical protein